MYAATAIRRGWTAFSVCAFRRNLRRSCRHCPADDGSSLLSYARSGAPCDGRRGSAHRLKKAGALDLEKALREMYSQGQSCSGGAWVAFGGACGAGISAGQFLAIATESTPLAREPWGLSNQMTSRALDSIEKRADPRCCKRIPFWPFLPPWTLSGSTWGVRMERTVPVCSYSSRNNQCIGKRCPFSAANHPKIRVAFLCVHNSCRSQIAEALGKSWPETYLKAFQPEPNPVPKSIPTRYA